MKVVVDTVVPDLALTKNCSFWWFSLSNFRSICNGEWTMVEHVRPVTHCCVSDTHGDHAAFGPTALMPEADVLLHAGQYCNFLSFLSTQGGVCHPLAILQRAGLRCNPLCVFLPSDRSAGGRDATRAHQEVQKALSILQY